jgi:hypothetical protein
MSQFPDVSSPYGAPMGRSGSFPGQRPDGKLRVYRVRLDRGGYDDGGAYWGTGEPLYCAEDGDTFRTFTRAYDRQEAYQRIGRNFGGPFQLAQSLR